MITRDLLVLGENHKRLILKLIKFSVRTLLSEVLILIRAGNMNF